MSPDPNTAAAGLAATKPGTTRRLSIHSALSVISNAVLHHRWFVALVVLFVAAAVFVGLVTGNSNIVSIRIYSDSLVLLIIPFILAAVLGHAIWMMIFVRPKGALAPALWADFNRRFLQKERIAGFLIVFLLVPLFFSAFSSFKRMIPYLNFWTLDPTFRDWDKFLHFGRHPWELTHAVLGTPLMTTGVNFFYHAWLFVMFFTLIWQAWNIKRPHLRMQYFVSFALMWIIIGTAMAILLSSAGPVYFSNVTGVFNPYLPLMSRLYELHQTSPVWALDLQQTLWANYAAGSTALKSGITAMPSMHVAASVHMALLGWSYNRWAGIGFTAFAIIIQIGSVHLGWHYAIDGYVSAVLVVLIWYGVGRVMRGSKRRS